MGRKLKEKQNRRMIMQKLTQRITTARDTIFEEMQAAGNFLRDVTEEADDKKGRNISNEEAGKQTSCILESDMSDKLPETFKNLFVAQYQQGSSSLSEGLRDFDNYLKCNYPNVFENMVAIISKIEELFFQNNPFVKKTLNQLSRIEAFETLTDIEDNENKTSDTMTMAVDKDKDDCIEITEGNSRKDRRKVEINNCDDNKRHPHSIQKLTAEEKLKKNGNEISGSIQETEETHNMELDDEARMKIIETTGENLVKTKYCSKMMHLSDEKYKKFRSQELRKLLISLYSENKTAREILNESKPLSTYLNGLKIYYLSENERKEFLKVFKETKEKIHKKNDTNIELENVEGYNKKTKMDSSIDRTEIPNQNTCESQKDNKTCTKYIETSNNDIQDSDSSKKLLNRAQETKDYDRRDNEKETMNSKHAKKSEKQASFLKLDKQENNSTDMNLKQIVREEIRDFSSEKEPLIAVSKFDSREETRDEINYVDGRKDENAAAAELNDEANELVKDLNKEDCIHFEFGINQKKYVFAGNQNDYYLLNENERIFFKYKDENVEVHFIGNQVFILTEDSEFNIFIRKSDTVNLTDVATQTSPNINIQ